MIGAALLALMVGVLLLASTKARPHAVALAGVGVTCFGWFGIVGWPLASLLLLIPLAVRPNSLQSSRPLSRMTVLAVMLAAAALITAVWSPSLPMAFGAAGGWVTLTAGIMLARLLSDDGDALRSAVRYALLPLGLLAVTVIAFRLIPALEYAYYQSSVARLFVGGTGAALSNGGAGWNNTVELDRAAGFLFVNVNRSSMVLGVAALVAFAAGLRYKSRGFKWAAILLVSAVALTGSKTGIAILAATAAILLAARLVSTQGDAVARGLTKLAALGAAVAAVRYVLASADGYVEESVTTLAPRTALWSESWRAIIDNWLAGLGFGGWEARWADGGVVVPFSATIRPAHNWFLQAWLDGGLIYVTLNVAFAWAVAALAWRSWKRACLGASLESLSLSLAPVWVVIHGLGDNTALYGDVSIALMLGTAFTLLRPSIERPEPRVDIRRSSRRTGPLGIR